jgi:hypothetical protein
MIRPNPNKGTLKKAHYKRHIKNTLAYGFRRIIPTTPDRKDLLDSCNSTSSHKHPRVGENYSMPRPYTLAFGGLSQLHSPVIILAKNVVPVSGCVISTKTSSGLRLDIAEGRAGIEGAIIRGGSLARGSRASELRRSIEQDDNKLTKNSPSNARHLPRRLSDGHFLSLPPWL